MLNKIVFHKIDEPMTRN